jgi:lipopolysaccharide export system protein LptA
LGFQSYAQKTVEIVRSNSLDFDSQIADAQRLIGNVVLKSGETLMYCDSAYLFSNDDFDAYGMVRIVQGDSLNLSGNSLKFSAADGIARLRDNIRMTDREMILTTDFLDYNLETEIAYYFNGGKIVSTQNENLLNSETGYYDSRSENLFFRKDVQLVNPEYTVECDTLRYVPATELSYFYGPTTIRSEDTRIYCENGWYNTKKEICQFRKNAEIISGANILRGDSIFYNGELGYGEVFENVSITDTTSEYIISGDFGWHDRNTENSLVTGHALLTQAMDEDSLFLHADTLRAIPDSMDSKRILAYRDVRFFKSDLQGRSDSLAYRQHDSTIYFYFDPVLWSTNNQLTGDSIRIRTFKGKVDRLYLNGNAFIISEVVEGKYNQIKGRDMDGRFRENELREVLVKGNGQTIYYPTEEKEDGSVKPVGLNTVDCSDIRIELQDQNISRIIFINQPSGQLLPQREVVEEKTKLEGFRWESDGRPQSVEDLFKD